MSKTEISAESQAARVSRGARMLRRVVLAGVIVLLGMTAAALLMPPIVPNGTHATVIAMIEIRDDGMPHAAALMNAVLLCGLLTIGLMRLVRMLRRIESGELFSARVTQDLRAFALFALLSALVSTLGPAVTRLFTAIGQNGSGEIKLGADNQDIWLLLFTGLLFLVARLLDEATRIVDDHKQIV